MNKNIQFNDLIKKSLVYFFIITGLVALYICTSKVSNPFLHAKEWETTVKEEEFIKPGTFVAKPMKVRAVHYCLYRRRNMLFLKTTICLLFLGLKLAETSSYRLPEDVIPEKYDLKIITYLEEGESNDFTFVGRVKIQVKCIKPTKSISLNSKELMITPNKSTITSLGADKSSIQIAREVTDTENEFHVIYLKDLLKEEQVYEIRIDFKGNLTDGLVGYYRSSYDNPQTGKKHWLATTQFEPTDARRAFPCFDEPSFKAKFTITLGHHKRFNSLSNMPLVNMEEMKDRPDWVWDFYPESVRMSTYLVAFIVTDFGFNESPKGLSHAKFQIWSRKSALDQTNFAAEVGPKALSYLENYFNIKYPLPKQDMIAIPDFSSGAMENWGLITYRENALLFDEVIGSTRHKYRVVSVICHELAHQWFGNLVTMKWWTDLWLNEGFATYMASLCVEHLFPKWNSRESESASNLIRVYDLDSLKSSHPVSVAIKHPSEINEIFDTISYKKGSFILQMMDLFLGENVLKKGVSNYLKTHAYNNAEQDDLWDALTKQAHQDQTLPLNLTVKEIMDTWTLQTGFPILNIQRNYDDKTVSVSQERYLKAPNKHRRRDVGNPCWWVPLTYTIKEEKEFNSTIPKSWLSCPKSVHVMSAPESDSWIIFNMMASGLYKVNYDEQNWKLLINQLKENFNDIHPLNRVLLIDNSMELAATGRLDYAVAFDLISYINQETEYIPWRTALSNLGLITAHFKRTPNYGLIRKYKRFLVEDIYEKFGGLEIQPEKRNSLDEVSHQVLIASAACGAGVQKCINESVSLFQSWMNNPEENPIGQDIRYLVYCKGIEAGNEDEWNFLWNKYKESNVGAERQSILSALACTQKVWLLTRYLDYSVGGDASIRNQDTFSVFSSVSSNSVGYYVAKSFFEENIKRIYEWIGSKKHRMGSFVKAIANEIINENEQKQFAKFIEENQEYFDKSRFGIQQALEEIEVSVHWHKKYYKMIEQILKSKLQNEYNCM